MRHSLRVGVRTPPRPDFLKPSWTQGQGRSPGALGLPSTLDMRKYHIAGVHLPHLVLDLLPQTAVPLGRGLNSPGAFLPRPQPRWPSECPLSPTRAGQQCRLLHQELLAGKEGLLGHVQWVVWLGQGLRRQEARLRRHGWCSLRGRGCWGQGWRRGHVPAGGCRCWRPASWLSGCCRRKQRGLRSVRPSRRGGPK